MWDVVICPSPMSNAPIVPLTMAFTPEALAPKIAPAATWPLTTEPEARCK
jgi:hypothetical protein